MCGALLRNVHKGLRFNFVSFHCNSIGLQRLHLIANSKLTSTLVMQVHELRQQQKASFLFPEFFISLGASRNELHFEVHPIVEIHSCENEVKLLQCGLNVQHGEVHFQKKVGIVKLATFAKPNAMLLLHDKK